MTAAKEAEILCRKYFPWRCWVITESAKIMNCTPIQLLTHKQGNQHEQSIQKGITS